jgi:hypothetical protein
MAPKNRSGTLPQAYACFISWAAANTIERQNDMTSFRLTSWHHGKAPPARMGICKLILKVTKANRKLYRRTEKNSW